MVLYASQQWFDKIYIETLPDVRRCAYSFLKSYPDLKAEVDDLIQETYMRMFQDREKLYERDEIVKWLVVTLRNLVSNRLRVRQTHIKHHIWNTDNNEILDYSIADPYAVVDQAFISEDQEKLDKIADHIGQDKVELLFEYYLDKVPLTVLAERENTTPDAMKMRISRLRKKCIEIFILILLLDALLLRGSLHIGGEGHGNQCSEEVLFRTRWAYFVDGRDEQGHRPDGYDAYQRVSVLSLPGKRGGRPRVH